MVYGPKRRPDTPMPRPPIPPAHTQLPPSEPPGPESAPTAVKEPAALFVWLWAAGLLAHMASFSEPLGAINLAMFALALLALRWPRRLLPFVGLLAVHLIHVWDRLPGVPNHAVLAAIVELTVLSAALAQAAQRRTLRLDARALYDSFAPALRIELLVLYLVVAFHKLNEGFFDPSTSCAAVMYLRIADTLPLLPTGDGARRLAIGGTLLIEAALPLLLLARRWRLLGLFVAFGFHFLLTLDPGEVVFNFTGILLALLALFVPEELAPAILQRAPSAGARLLGGALALPLAALVFREALDLGLTRESARAAWVVYAAFVLGTFIAALRESPARWPPARALLAPRGAALLVFPALLLFNGLTPYLGAKTELSLSMYSNLRTEGGRSNHWLVPSAFQLWDYQRDLVTIRSSTDGPLRRLGKQGLQLPWFELRRWAQQNPRASLTWERGGVVRVSAPIGAEPELMREESPLLRKILRFRPVSADPSRSPCLH